MGRTGKDKGTAAINETKDFRQRMTAEEAQTIIKQYENLKGQRTLTGETITAITIAKAEDGGFMPVAFYYRGDSSHTGEDPVEWYKDRPLSGQRRSFSIRWPIETKKPATSIISQADIIVNTGMELEWMIGKSLIEIRSYLMKQRAEVIESKY